MTRSCSQHQQVITWAEHDGVFFEQTSHYAPGRLPHAARVSASTQTLSKSPPAPGARVKTDLLDNAHQELVYLVVQYGRDLDVLTAVMHCHHLALWKDTSMTSEQWNLVATFCLQRVAELALAGLAGECAYVCDMCPWWHSVLKWVVMYNLKMR